MIAANFKRYPEAAEMQLCFDFSVERLLRAAIQNSAHAKINGGSYRSRVLKVLDGTDKPLTGAQISVEARLSYKQTIDALNALYNHGKVGRTGRKYWARWEKAKPKTTETDSVQMLILRYMTVKHE